MKTLKKRGKLIAGALLAVVALSSCALTDREGDVLVKVKHPKATEFRYGGGAVLTGDVVYQNAGRARPVRCKVIVRVRMMGGAVITRTVPVAEYVEANRTERERIRKTVRWEGTAREILDPKLAC